MEVGCFLQTPTGGILLLFPACRRVFGFVFSFSLQVCLSSSPLYQPNKKLLPLLTDLPFNFRFVSHMFLLRHLPCLPSFPAKAVLPCVRLHKSY